MKRWYLTTYDLNRLSAKPFNLFLLLFIPSLPPQGEAQTSCKGVHVGRNQPHLSLETLPAEVKMPGKPTSRFKPLVLSFFLKNMKDT